MQKHFLVPGTKFMYLNPDSLSQETFRITEFREEHNEWDCDPLDFPNANYSRLFTEEQILTNGTFLATRIYHPHIGDNVFVTLKGVNPSYLQKEYESYRTVYPHRAYGTMIEDMDVEIDRETGEKVYCFHIQRSLSCD